MKEHQPVVWVEVIDEHIVARDRYGQTVRRAVVELREGWMGLEAGLEVPAKWGRPPLPAWVVQRSRGL